jgi:hypothetical protein
MTTAPFYTIWAAIGPLIGVALGVWLTARLQHRLWALDNKKAEYGKVLEKVATYRYKLLNWLALHRPDVTARELAITAYEPRAYEEQRRALAEVQASLSNALRDGLLIQEALIQSGVPAEFERFARSLDVAPGPSITEAAQALESLRSRIIKTAEPDLGMRANLQRCRFLERRKHG